MKNISSNSRGKDSGSSHGYALRYKIAELRAEFGDSSTDEPSDTEVLIVGQVKSVDRKGGVIRVEVADDTGEIIAWMEHSAILSHIEIRHIHHCSLIGIRGRVFRFSDLHILAETILLEL